MKREWKRCLLAAILAALPFFGACARQESSDRSSVRPAVSSRASQSLPLVTAVKRPNPGNSPSAVAKNSAATLVPETKQDPRVVPASDRRVYRDDYDSRQESLQPLRNPVLRRLPTPDVWNDSAESERAAAARRRVDDRYLDDERRYSDQYRSNKQRDTYGGSSRFRDERYGQEDSLRQNYTRENDRYDDGHRRHERYTDDYGYDPRIDERRRDDRRQDDPRWDDRRVEDNRYDDRRYQDRSSDDPRSSSRYERYAPRSNRDLEPRSQRPAYDYTDTRRDYERDERNAYAYDRREFRRPPELPNIPPLPKEADQPAQDPPLPDELRVKMQPKRLPDQRPILRDADDSNPTTPPAGSEESPAIPNGNKVSAKKPSAARTEQVSSVPAQNPAEAQAAPPATEENVSQQPTPQNNAESNNASAAESAAKDEATSESPSQESAESAETSEPEVPSSISDEPALTAPATNSQSQKRPFVPQLMPQTQPLEGTTPGPNPNIAAVAARADGLARHAMTLAKRGAIYSSRAELIQALRLIAQALDTEAASQERSHRLAAGLRALEEADDFSPQGARLDADLNVRAIIATHKTTLLKDVDPATVQPLAAMQHYYTFAQEQIASASGHEPAASLALFGLGRLYTSMSDQSSQFGAMSGPKAIVFHQAAILVDRSNYRAANELGVLLAKYGQLQQAREAFQLSVSIFPMAETWHNLSVVHQRLGEAQLSNQARLQSQAMGRAAAATSHPLAQMVKWIPPQDFARASGQGEGEWASPQMTASRSNVPQVAAQPMAGPAGPMARPMNPLPQQPTATARGLWSPLPR